jgi:hypothetical protein
MENVYATTIGIPIAAMMNMIVSVFCDEAAL